MDSRGTAATWKGLAKSYETARTRPDSLDVLMEFPAQLSLIGDVRGKRVLDLACGSGAKAIHLAHQGAREVVGIDISETFMKEVGLREAPPTTRFLRGDISRLGEIDGLTGPFDIVLLLNALGYADDELVTLSGIRSLVADDGAFILARAHPLRFAVVRSESTGVEVGAAYHDRSPIPYASGWDPSVPLTHRPATFADTVNRLVQAGFWIDCVIEPTLTDEQRRRYPPQAALAGSLHRDAYRAGTATSSVSAPIPAAHGVVTAVASGARHGVGKPSRQRIRLIEGLGVHGDAHCGEKIRHRSRVARDPEQPNLRQVHLIHGELHDELRERGLAVSPGQMGENITTRGLELLALPVATRLWIGEMAVVEVTGLRNPCRQLNEIQPGLMGAVLARDANGGLIRKAGIMGIVMAGGEIRPGDPVQLELPAGAHQPLAPV